MVTNMSTPTEYGEGRGLWVIVTNSLGCELDRQFCTTSREVGQFSVDFIRDYGMNDGDVMSYLEGDEFGPFEHQQAGVYA